MNTFIHRADFASAWYDLLGRLYNDGAPVAPRGFETHELLGVQVRVDDMTRCVLVHPARGLNYRFMVAEWLWIAAHRQDVATLAKYNKQMAQFSDDGVILAGAYGPRMEQQVVWMMDQLRAKPDTRQALATIWTTTPAFSRDIPCTISWQLLARDGALHAIVNMRSSDVHLGLPYDFFSFAQLTNGIAGELGLTPGSLIFNLGSSHLYMRDAEKAALVFTTPNDLRCISSPRLPSRPPANEVLKLNSWLTAPWSAYRDALMASTSVDALAVLRGLVDESSKH